MIIQLSARTISMPNFCACCGGNADSQVHFTASRTTGKRVTHTTTRGWSFPYCGRCVEHSAAWNSRYTAFASIVIVSVLAGLTYFGEPSAAGAIFIIGNLGALAVSISNMSAREKRARALCTPNCQGPGSAVAYHGWQGSVQTFDVASTRFAEAFLRANNSKAINLSPTALSALSAATVRTVPSSVRTAAAPPGRMESDEDKLLRYMDKLAAARSGTTRQSIMEAGIRELSSPDAITKLRVATAAIEVQAVLEKVAALKTPSAKRRNLESALIELGNRELPRELLSDEFAVLQKALAEIDAPGR